MRITDHIDPPDHVEPIRNRAPVLVPAFPAVLRAGLSIVVRGPMPHVGPDEYLHTVVVVIGGPVVHFWHMGGARGALKDAVFVDLRDPAVRDAVVRALWRKLRPDEPEPLTAPRFWHPAPLATRWLVYGDDGSLMIRLAPVVSFEDVDVAVPALASIPLDSPDRDLLALAEVAKAVLGAS